MRNLRQAIETYRRTGYVVAYTYLREVAADYGLTVAEALRIPSEPTTDVVIPRAETFRSFDDSSLPEPTSSTEKLR